MTSIYTCRKCGWIGEVNGRPRCLACSRRQSRDYHHRKKAGLLVKVERGTLEAQFWAKIDLQGENGCWLWTGTKNGRGYGLLRVDDRTPGTKRKQALAHRFAWEFVHGPIPAGMEVCHNCPAGDNPTCCNPAHLFLGTHAENMKDAARKGQLPHGERSGAFVHKLNEWQVVGIMARRLQGVSRAAVAREFSVAPNSVFQIEHGKTWRRLFTEEG